MAHLEAQIDERSENRQTIGEIAEIGEIVQGQVGYSPSKYSEEYYRSGQPTGIGVSNNLMGRRRRECASPTVLLAKFSLQSCPVTPQRSVFNGLAAGAPGRIRTRGPQIRSLVLYPAELPVQGGDSRR